MNKHRRTTTPTPQVPALPGMTPLGLRPAAATDRYAELTRQEQLEIDDLINAIAAHRGIDHQTMRDARTSVRRATKEIRTACAMLGC